MESGLALLQSIVFSPMISPSITQPIRLALIISDLYHTTSEEQKDTPIEKTIKIAKSCSSIASMKYSLGYIGSIITIAHTWIKINKYQNNRFLKLQKPVLSTWSLCQGVWSQCWKYWTRAEAKDDIELKDYRR